MFIAMELTREAMASTHATPENTFPETHATPENTFPEKSMTDQLQINWQGRLIPGISVY
jgi:hypothetical protein